MPKAIHQKSSQERYCKSRLPRLFVLELNADRIHSMNTDGTDRKNHRDGMAACLTVSSWMLRRVIYWTNMGIPRLE